MTDYDKSNIFARIIKGELPAHKVYEDEHTLSFMDIMPQIEGHTLVIPKAPYENLLTASPETLQHAVVATQKIARAVQSAFSAPGIMIMQLNGAAAGQTVFHLHFHILPRYQGLESGLHGRTPAEDAVLAEHAGRIRSALNAL